MSVSLSIHPHAHHLDMYGDPDIESAYSLSGHVAVSLSSSPSSFFSDRRRSGRYLLQSLSLTFEGQSEIFTPAMGYSAFRLCSITRELVPSQEAIELSNEGHEESEEPCVWNIIFNMTVPGWLPASSGIGIEEVGVRYAVYATAKLLDLEDNKSNSWGFTAFCAPFRSKTKYAYGQKNIELRRFGLLPSHSLGTVNYQVKNPSISTVGLEEGKQRIPSDVLEKIQVVLSLPEVVDMSKKKVDVTLRMRSKGLDEDERKRIRILDVNLSLRQFEKCRTLPSRSYQNRYPLPPLEQQPPNCPLLDPSPIATVYDVGIIPVAERRESQSRSFALIPSHQSGQFKFDESNTLLFANDPEVGDSGAQSTWYNLEMRLPFVKKAIVDDDWDIAAVLRPTASTPLFVVYHELTVAITCSYSFPDSESVAQEKLSFTVSPSFGHVAPPASQPPVSHDSIARESNTPSLPVVAPYAPTLPVYSQLYDASGDIRIDYSVPLPLYTPPENATKLNAPVLTTSAETTNVSVEDDERWKDVSTRQSIDNESDDGETAPLLGTSTS